MAKRRYYRIGMVQWDDDEGHFHRAGGPASVWPHGMQLWYRRGRFHFAHGPAIIWPGGRLRWYEDGQLLRRREPYG